MMRAIIVAYSKNRVIGKDNDLPWYLPADLRRFKELTTGHTVIMGRKTHESILNRLGTVLPNRKTIVLTHQKALKNSEALVASSLENAISLADDDTIFIIGGASVFKEALNLVERIYATEVKAYIDGDILMPEFDSNEWSEVAREENYADEKNEYDYDFVVYERVR